MHEYLIYLFATSKIKQQQKKLTRMLNQLVPFQRVISFGGVGAQFAGKVVSFAAIEPQMTIQGIFVFVVFAALMALYS